MSMYEGERRFMRDLRAKVRNVLAWIGAAALILAVIFGWHTWKALVFYSYYLSGV